MPEEHRDSPDKQLAIINNLVTENCSGPYETHQHAKVIFKNKVKEEEPLTFDEYKAKNSQLLSYLMSQCEYIIGQTATGNIN
jgi:hypothetical protein